MLKKTAYGLVGLLAGGLILGNYLSEIPETYVPKSTRADFMNVETNEDERAERPREDHGTGDEVIALFNTYHIDEQDMVQLEEDNIAAFGRNNPMYFWHYVERQPEAEEDYTFGDLEDDLEIPQNESLGFNTRAQGGDDQFVSTDTRIIMERFKEGAVLPVDEEFYNFSSEFGPRIDPINGQDNVIHTGLDIAYDSIDGQNVYSVLDGEVTFIGDDPSGFGHYVIVEHDGFTTLYAHLKEAPSIEEGTEVKAGDVVGKIGSTGRSTGPHLHLEIEIDGVKVDPKGFLDLIQ